jgi:arsenate reductase
MIQPTDTPFKILFVCIGNACRSQMAEAWMNHFGKGKVQAFSAGSYHLGVIPTETYDVMREKGISLEDQRSKGLREVSVSEMDVVVEMGYEVACPVPAGFKGRIIEWSIPDPYNRGIESFRDVRDMLERQVLTLLADLAPSPQGNRQ